MLCHRFYCAVTLAWKEVGSEGYGANTASGSYQTMVLRTPRSTLGNALTLQISLQEGYAY